jgi:16S rRNA (guanine527-N7)-methyltransferase
VTIDKNHAGAREPSLALGAQTLGVNLTEDQLTRFDIFQREILDWNERMNLTAITNPLAVQTRHFLDSLTALAAIRGTEGLTEVCRQIVDVGSGAGLPGIPLAIVLPRSRITLVEATQKKCRFLDHVIGTLGLQNVVVVTGRSEDVAHRSDMREVFDTAIARALAALPTLVELGLPFLRIGGRLIAMKKIGIDEEVRSAGAAVTLLGGRLRSSIIVRVPILDEPRQLVVVEKVRPTPGNYPRRAGLPGKSPLGMVPDRPPGLQKSARLSPATDRPPGTGRPAVR